MLQRIQTVYLLIITVLSVSVLFRPLAILQLGDLFYSFDAYGVSLMDVKAELLYPSWGLFALTTIIALLSFVTIFLYKKRMLQIRLCVFNAILMVGFYALFCFFVWTIKKEQGDVLFSYKVSLLFPFVCIILDYLAIRNIGADETLVRSLDRLR